MPAAPTVVDWTLARSTATRLVKRGPAISADGALATVAGLRDAAVRAERYVTEVTGLEATSGTAPVLVVDRSGWIQANLDAFRLLLTPLTAKASTKMASSPRAASLGSRVTGAEMGVLLSYLAPKVLGQFDPFWTGADGARGRLLLVAPNIVEVERLLRVPPTDFRLWVCLHEETHRVQFTAVPWLRDHLLGLIDRLVATTDFDNGVLSQVVREAVRRIVEGIREGAELSIIDLVQTPAQRAIVDEITAVMSLLEGHADVVMDSVGPEVVPSVAQIRAKFDVRRQGQGADKIVRRLLGLDAKMRQYRDGAAFCRQVLDEVGMTGLNRVWTSPDTLPNRAEIANPQLWVIRNHPEPVSPSAG
jgi:coenzyme F420 biosynthesis associated uncharacterized protein